MFILPSAVYGSVSDPCQNIVQWQWLIFADLMSEKQYVIRAQLHFPDSEVKHIFNIVLAICLSSLVFPFIGFTYFLIVCLLLVEL